MGNVSSSQQHKESNTHIDATPFNNKNTNKKGRHQGIYFLVLFGVVLHNIKVNETHRLILQDPSKH